MRFETITENGVTHLEDGNSKLRVQMATTVVIDSNSASATVTIGYLNASDEFKAYPEGLFIVDTPGKLVWHGAGVKLAVKAEDITTGTLVIGWTD
jgi:hypothetical protein